MDIYGVGGSSSIAYDAYHSSPHRHRAAMPTLIFSRRPRIARPGRRGAWHFAPAAAAMCGRCAAGSGATTICLTLRDVAHHEGGRHALFLRREGGVLSDAR